VRTTSILVAISSTSKSIHKHSRLISHEDTRVVGKNKWPPIDQGMIEWRPGMAQNDPAGDLAHVTLTLPTPPPSVYQQQQQQQQQQRHQPPSGRAIKPFPMYNRPRIASNVTRTVSVAMASPEDHYTPHIMSQGYAYPHHEPQPPLYGEDQVPMTGQMPAAGPSEVPGTAATLAPAQSPWDGMSEVRGTKRARSDVSDHEENGDGSRSGEELGFGEHRDTLWQE